MHRRARTALAGAALAGLAACASVSPPAVPPDADPVAAAAEPAAKRVARYSLPAGSSWQGGPAPHAAPRVPRVEMPADPEKILSGEWPPESIEPAPPATVAELAIHALNYLGVPYRSGGSSPDAGFDCSGLVGYVSREVLGLRLPRRAEEISRLGEPVSLKELRPGDLVFYNTLRRKFSHVGIYLGDGRFVHSPASGGVVRIESMDLTYWKKRFNGARRLASVESASR